MSKQDKKKKLTSQLNKEDLKKIFLYIAAFTIPAGIILAIFIYLKVFPFGENCYLPVDATGQYVSYLNYFRNIFSEGSSIFYSLSKSLGGDMYGLFAYYLNSPYNFVTLLFEKSIAPFAFMLIIVLKTGSCGLTFLYYLNRRKKANFSNLIFSTMYAMCAYIIMYGFNIMWLDAVILLPIVMAGIDDIVKHKKFVLYSVSLTLTLIINYYIGFMVCIFSAIYFAYKMLLRRVKPIKKFFKKIGIFVLCSIIAALIAGVVLIPVFFDIQEGRADFTLESFTLDKNFEIPELICKFFTNSFDLEAVKNDAAPPVFCGVLANVLVMLYFLNNKISIKEKILSLFVIAIFVLSFYLNGANLVWTMGNSPAWYKYRYAFTFSFMYILFAKREFENLKKGTRIWHIIIMILIYQAISIFISNCNYEFLDKNSIKIDIILVLAFSLLLILYKKRIKRERKLNKYYLPVITLIIYLLNTGNLTNNAITTMKILREETSGIKQEQYGFQCQGYEKVINNLKKYDNDIYRVEKELSLNMNDPLSFGYNGVTFSASTYSEELYTFLNRLGLEQHYVVADYSENTNKAVDMLLGIKYIISFNKEGIKKEYNKEYEEEKGLSIYKNPYALTLGYFVDDEILNINMDKSDTFNLQNTILRSMTGFDKDVYIKNNGEITKKTYNLDEHKKVDKEKDAKIVYEFEVENENDLYLYFLKNNAGTAEIYVNGERQIDLETDQNEMLNIGKRKLGEKITVEIKAKEDELKENKLYVYYEDEEILSVHYNILKTGQIELKKINNTHYECRINSNNNKKYLLLTIPYSDYWKITVDGKTVSTQKALDALTLIEINNDAKSVRLTYTNSKIVYGAIMSLVGIIGFGIMIFINKKII